MNQDTAGNSGRMGERSAMQALFLKSPQEPSSPKKGQSNDLRDARAAGGPVKSAGSACSQSPGPVAVCADAGSSSLCRGALPQRRSVDFPVASAHAKVPDVIWMASVASLS